MRIIPGKWRVLRATNGIWFTTSPWEWHEAGGQTSIRQRQCGHGSWREAYDYADRMARWGSVCPSCFLQHRGECA